MKGVVKNAKLAKNAEKHLVSSNSTPSALFNKEWRNEQKGERTEKEGCWVSFAHLHFFPFATGRPPTIYLCHKTTSTTCRKICNFVSEAFVAKRRKTSRKNAKFLSL